MMYEHTTTPTSRARLGRLLMPAMAALLTTAWGCSSTTRSQGGQDGDSLFAAHDADAEAVAAELSFASLFERDALLAGVDQVWLDRVQIDRGAMAHTRIYQTVNNVPVFGGEAIVHIGRDGRFKDMTDNFIRGIEVDTRPALRLREAVDLAVDANGGWDRIAGTPRADLQILRHDGVDHLTYRVQLERADKPSLPVLFIDAHTGEDVWSYDNLETYTLADADAETYDMGNKTNYSIAPLADSSDPVALEAHDNVHYTLDYYLTTHGRDSIADDGAIVESYVHYKRNYVNAFWDGSVLTLGDGDGTTSSPLVVLDVIAHEFTHGVTENTAGLVYSNESGALNESMSDIFGAATEAFRDGGANANTWLVGEECWTPATPGDALRYMFDPTLDGSSRDHYSTRYTGTSDNGGVHSNSGISNLAFYLLSEGGSHPDPSKSVGTVNGIGIDNAAAIFYQALRFRMTSTTDFASAAAATEGACADLGFSTADCDAVTAAWAEVGVVSNGNGGGGGGGNCNGATVTALDQSGLSGNKNELLTFQIDVPANACDLVVTTTGSDGDADLYVKFGSTATPSDFDCGSFSPTSNESCTIGAPSAGTYHVSVHAYRRFTGLSLTGTYQEP